ncbi:MAG: UDP-N-acetylmuramoyl-L-alanyl-D-glutamate--2,6-diaminopimelate ligase [Clostridia bacterium]|nr:UDP-N-acetylmuramoyl-L-alanyl-D-glutamate--2,6-diaminopimelate ligase [Clostridia bacterium]
MRLDDILYGTDVIAACADASADIKDVVNDSDKAAPHTVFCACRGERENGEDYIAQALQRRCAAVICEHAPAVPCAYVTVPDAREAYARACARINGDPQKKLRLFAVTGTNGKTTTTSMLHHILCRLYGKDSAALIGGVDNIVCGNRYRAEMTTPDPHELYAYLAQAVKGGARYGVIEASSHALDYKKLVPCRFDVGAMTNLTEDHLDHHKTMDEYFISKQKLIPLCGRFVSNEDDVYTRRIDCPHFSLYGAEFTAEIISLDKNGSVFRYHGMTDADCRISVCGKFNVYNALAALCMAELAGTDGKYAADALSDFQGVRGRFTVHELKNGADAVIDYAHTPDALENALLTARQLYKDRLISVFGCGGDRDRNKRAVMGAISSRIADLTVITEDNSRSEEPGAIIKDILKGVDKNSAYKVIEDRKSAILYALGIARGGDVVLLAGKGHEDYETDREGKRPFSEAEIIREFNNGG